MRDGRRWFGALCVAGALAGLLSTGGCATGAQTGALAGAGIGALAGQLIGGNTAGTLIGAAVGTGVGYLIGNEEDKKRAEAAQRVAAEETVPLGGTTWQLVSINPRPKDQADSVVSQFFPDGTVVTKSVDDGKTTTERETYRIVGDTLIINKPGYIVNARFRIKGDELILNTGEYSVVMQRL